MPESFSYFSVASQPFRLDGMVIYPNTKVFEVGDYPDKRFSLSDAEAEKAVRDFCEVKLDVEHTPSVLDGKIGHLTEVRKSGREIFGTVVVPDWFNDNVLADSAKKVSATWDRTTKMIAGLAVVRNPRVTDAAMMAAFAASRGVGEDKHMDYAKNPLQAQHDIACAHGAECGGTSTFSDEGLAEFMTPEMLKAVQKTHDASCAGGASCDEYQTRKNTGMPVHQAEFGVGNAAGFSDDEREELSELRGQVAEFSAQVVDLVAEATLARRSAEVEKAKAYFNGKRDEMVLTPSQAETYIDKVVTDPAKFSLYQEIVDEMPVNAALAGNRKRATIAGETVRGSRETASFNSQTLADKAKAYAKENSVPFNKALEAIAREDPDAIIEMRNSIQ